MKNRIKRFFTTNIGWKIAAVFAGIIIWALLSNTQDPFITTTVPIPITYLNEDLLLERDGLCVLSRPETVTITARVATSNRNKATASLFTCTADLVDHSGGDLSSQRIHISVQQVGGNNIVIDWNYYRSDPNITVVMDEYISKDFTVALKSDGSLSQDAQFQGQVEFTPSVITVSGPKSRFTNVNSIKATVDLTELNSRGPGAVTEENIPVHLYDSNDEEIRNTDGVLSLSAETVSLSATIARLREVTVTMEGVTGTPAEGFRYDSSLTTLNPQVIVVKGLKGNLSELNTVTIPADLVNIDGISGQTSYEIDLAQLLPEGVSIAEGSSTAVVTVNVEALVAEERQYNTSNIEILNRDELLLYDIREPFVNVRVRGFSEDLGVLDLNSSLKAYVDASALEPGIHTVPVITDPIAGYYLDGIDSLSVTLAVRINEALTTTAETETEETGSGDPSEKEPSENGSSAESETGTTEEPSLESESESESETESQNPDGIKSPEEHTEAEETQGDNS